MSFLALRGFWWVADDTASCAEKSRRPSLRNIIVSKYPVFLKPLAARLMDWAIELSPSRIAFVEHLRHQSGMPSRSLRSVPATTLVSGTFEHVIQEHGRSSANAADLRSGSS